VASLEDRLREGASALVGNRRYRRFLRGVPKGSLAVDRREVDKDARYDGKFALRTNTELPAAEVALQHERLMRVERFFRAATSLLDSRSISHQTDAAIRGHVFTSFLALVLVHELESRLGTRGEKLEWNDVLRDLGALAEVEVRDGGEVHVLRKPLGGVGGKVLQAAGVGTPPSVRLEAGVPRG
jgi:hypothetical protein